VVTKVNDHEHLLELYQQYTEGGAEGIIIREPSSFYETKRSKLLLKMKIGEDDEANRNRLLTSVKVNILDYWVP